jgi:hypothetical protein
MSEVLSFRSPAAPRKPKRRILSATTLRALKPPPKGSVDYFDDMTPGLFLRVTANDPSTLSNPISRRSPAAAVDSLADTTSEGAQSSNH